MDFGSILDQWDDLRKKGAGTTRPASTAGRGVKKANAPFMEGSQGSSRQDSQDADDDLPAVNPQVAWMRLHGFVDKDREDEEAETSAERRRRLHRSRPDAVLDLHGLTRDEAHEQLERFFNLAKRDGYEKVQIVHGKGNHSEGEAILKRDVRLFLEACPWAGESGDADVKSGGTGATWVLLK